MRTKGYCLANVFSLVCALRDFLGPLGSSAGSDLELAAKAATIFIMMTALSPELMMTLGTLSASFRIAPGAAGAHGLREALSSQISVSQLRMNILAL